MGYFEGQAEACFKKDEDGHTIFYPFGVLAKGVFHYSAYAPLPNWGFNSDTNSGHAFAIFMPALAPSAFCLRCR